MVSGKPASDSVLLLFAFFGTFLCEIKAECGCYNSTWDGRCLSHCTGDCLKECKQLFQDTLSEILLNSFKVSLNLRGKSVNGSLEFNKAVFKDIEPLTVEKCTLLYSAAIVNVYGKPELAGDGWKEQTEALNVHRNNYFHVALNELNTLYVAIAECRFKNSWVVTSPKKFLTKFAEGVIQPPKNLVSFFGTKIYGRAEDVNHLTLRWEPLSQWTSLPLKYHVQCREVSESCSQCMSNYEECRKCKVQTTWIQNKIVDWFKWYKFIRIYRSITDLRNKGQVVVCAVRAIGAGWKRSKWSKPVVEKFERPNPSPKLIVSHIWQQKDGSFRNSWVFVDMILTDPKAKTERNSYPVLWNSEERVNVYNIDAECCTKYNKYFPWIFGISNRSPKGRDPGAVQSFCLNWIIATHYESKNCSHDPELWCITEVDDTTGNTTLIYTAAPGRKISQVLCNPHRDFVAFSEEDFMNYTEQRKNVSLSLLFFTNETVVKVEDFDDVTIMTSAITLDWTDDVGSVVFVGENQQHELAAYRYNPDKSNVHQLGLLPRLKNAENIKKIGLDWSNFYWVIDMIENNQTELQFVQWKTADRNEFDKNNVFKVKNLVTLNEQNQGYESTGLNILGKTAKTLVNISVEEVVDILPMAGEMRKILPADQYYPEIQVAKNESVSPTTLQIQVNYTYKSRLYSLQPVFQLIFRYKKYIKGDTQACKKQIDCETVQTGMNFGRRSNMVQMSIGGLENWNKYYVEVELNPLRSGIYFQHPRKNDYIFHLHYTPPPLISKAAMLITVLIVIGMLVIFLSVAVVAYIRSPERQLILIRIKEKDVKLIKPPIGRGVTSEVYKAVLLPSRQTVAVKRPKDSASEKEKTRLLHEALILQHLNHPNIIKAIGICLDTKPYKLVMDYKPHGNLINFLQKRARIPQSTLLQIAIDIAKACCYLTQEGYLHRDISAKNVLIMLGKEGKFLQAYLSDFGLARDRGEIDEPYSTEIPECPILHSAPEAFRGRFSAKSDVFSYGVLLFEIFTHGETPYSDIFDFAEIKEQDGDLPYRELQHMICQEGLRPDADIQPEGCPDDVYQLMSECWNRSPTMRPTFQEVKDRLESIRYKLTNKQELPDIVNLPHWIKDGSCSVLSKAYSEEQLPILGLEHVQVAYTDRLDVADLHNFSPRIPEIRKAGEYELVFLDDDQKAPFIGV